VGRQVLDGGRVMRKAPWLDTGGDPDATKRDGREVPPGGGRKLSVRPEVRVTRGLDRGENLNAAGVGRDHGPLGVNPCPSQRPVSPAWGPGSGGGGGGGGGWAPVG